MDNHADIKIWNVPEHNKESDLVLEKSNAQILWKQNRIDLFTSILWINESNTMYKENKFKTITSR